MSNVETGAERDLIDLDHFVYSTGSIGSLKTLSVVPVVAGDSFQLDVVGVSGDPSLPFSPSIPSRPFNPSLPLVS